jgi:hypothetical protein
MDELLPTPFTESEMAAVHKVIWERRSCRDWQEKEVSDEMI